MQTFQAGDEPVRGYLALPQSGTGPGVLVLHAWWGLVPTLIEVCERLAAAGFVAVAPISTPGAPQPRSPRPRRCSKTWKRATTARACAA